MVHNYEIEYENVYLRPLAEEDIESLRKWRNDPSNTLYLNKIPYITSAMQIDWFKRYLQNNDELCFAIVETHNFNRLVGSLSLYEFNNKSCMFGKIMIGDKEAHGRKLGLNATIAATIIAFDWLDLKKINLYVYSENIAALKVYQKAGFVVSEEYQHSNGKTEYTMTIERGGA